MVVKVKADGGKELLFTQELLQKYIEERVKSARNKLLGALTVELRRAVEDQLRASHAQKNAKRAMRLEFRAADEGKAVLTEGSEAAQNQVQEQLVDVRMITPGREAFAAVRGDARAAQVGGRLGEIRQVGRPQALAIGQAARRTLCGRATQILACA